LQERLLLLTF